MSILIGSLKEKEIVNEIESHTNIVIYAPGRYGKTSLVLQSFSDLKRKNMISPISETPFGEKTENGA